MGMDGHLGPYVSKGDGRNGKAWGILASKKGPPAKRSVSRKMRGKGLVQGRRASISPGWHKSQHSPPWRYCLSLHVTHCPRWT